MSLVEIAKCGTETRIAVTVRGLESEGYHRQDGISFLARCYYALLSN